jgi:hypothetical protein
VVKSRVALEGALVAQGRYEKAEGEIRRALNCFEERDSEGLQTFHELAEILAK